MTARFIPSVAKPRFIPNAPPMDKDIRVVVGIVGTGIVGTEHVWDERYTTSKDPETFAKGLIDNFNKTLRPGELARRLVRVEVVGEVVGHVNHKWSKTNLITKMGSRGATYDEMKCDRCGITGRRYGLGEHIARNKKYDDNKFMWCKP